MLSKIVDSFLILFLVIYLVLDNTHYILLQNDNRIEAYVRMEASEYVSEVTHKGYISKEDYGNFMKKLAVTNKVYNVELYHKKQVVYPLTAGDPGYTVTKPYKNLTYEYGTEYIYSILDTKDYDMNEGDSFSVTISPKTLGDANVLQMFLLGNISTFNVTAGGRVENAIR